MAVGAVVGGLYGQQMNTYKDTHTAMYSGIGAATGALVSNILLNPDENSEKLAEENKKLTEELNKFKTPLPVAEGKNLFSTPIPKDLSRVIRPGEWRRYKLDQWVKDNSQENVWYRQTEMFEIIPPESN